MTYLLAILDHIQPREGPRAERYADAADDPRARGALHYIDGDRSDIVECARVLDLEPGHLARLLTNAVLAWDRAATQHGLDAERGQPRRAPLPVYADGGRLAVTYVPGHVDVRAAAARHGHPSARTDSAHPVWRVEVVHAGAHEPAGAT